MTRPNKPLYKLNYQSIIHFKRNYLIFTNEYSRFLQFVQIGNYTSQQLIFPLSLDKIQKYTKKDYNPKYPHYLETSILDDSLIKRYLFRNTEKN